MQTIFQEIKMLRVGYIENTEPRLLVNRGKAEFGTLRKIVNQLHFTAHALWLYLRDNSVDILMFCRLVVG